MMCELLGLVKFYALTSKLCSVIWASGVQIMIVV